MSRSHSIYKTQFNPNSRQTTPAANPTPIILNANEFDLALPVACDRGDVVGEKDALVLEAEAECRLDDTENVEALAGAFVGKRQVDLELKDLPLEWSDLEQDNDVDGVCVANLLEVDVNLSWGE